MRHHTILKLLLAAFFLYLAWPAIPVATTSIAQLFWVCWLFFFLFVVGANLATLLNITEPPIVEQKNESERRTLKG